MVSPNAISPRGAGFAGVCFESFLPSIVMVAKSSSTIFTPPFLH
ncbi:MULTISPECIES: hypothetical protein [Methanobacterium]|uniref:Uncharacterized protein n=1 Tax=Methanobacterium veterum TaxID=408577 RepID=A0A9E4ZXL0_9EURY|nr:MULTISPECIES: hypothetical protein [Methanobacterium]MCZ3367417.1 hypothetical protein [Methanobacterium veterum]MCZ3373435.1 hypothetical protein [Methanobacterium veterum]